MSPHSVADFRNFYDFDHLPEPTLAEIRQSLMTYANCLKRFGRKVEPFAGADLPLFAKATRKAKVRAALYLNFNIEVMQEALASAEAPDERRLLWRILAKAKLTPTSDILDRLEDGDIIEVYLMKDQLQIYRNLRFFDICSMSLEHMLFLPWYKMGHRSLRSTLQMLKVVAKLRWGGGRQTLNWNVPTHTCLEYFGEKRRFDITMKLLSPTFADGKVVGAVSTNHSVLL